VLALEHERLFDEALQWALKGLQLPRRRSVGPAEGAHLGTRGGPGEDFFQHRAYVAGEDLRTVDFRASARSGQLLVKELHRPLRQPLVLVVDASASMGLYGKLRCALQLAAGLGLLALRRGDPVSLVGLQQARLLPLGRLLAPRHPALAVEAMFGRLERTGAAQLFEALGGPWPVSLSGAHVVVISDLYGPLPGATEAFARLTALAAAVTVVQVLAPAELALPPEVRTLRDVETDEETLIGPEERDAFAQRVEAWRVALRAAIAGRGAFLDVDASVPAGLTLRRWLA
jgi:uncharacterized protein (DUF58 family)